MSRLYSWTRNELLFTIMAELALEEALTAMLKVGHDTIIFAEINVAVNLGIVEAAIFPTETCA